MFDLLVGFRAACTLRRMSLALAAGLLATGAVAEDGYRLWLRYDPVPDQTLRQTYAAAAREIAIDATNPTLAAARDEMVAGLRGLLGAEVPVVTRASGSGAVLLGTPAGNRDIAAVDLGDALQQVGDEGYLLRRVRVGQATRLVVAANSDLGVLYGTFALLRHLQTGQPLEGLSVASAPKIKRRLLNHWDNLDGFVERGYAGFSLWKWFYLPDVIDPRYRDYARACASIGINGAALTNVNANALVLTPQYLRKVAALAGVFRPYGIRVYLTARFSAPIEIGGLKTADPLDPAVREWWARKADEIYQHIPDFGGFLVKANSEGQPGPQDYGRSHADGANMMADALAPHGGIVMWRAFVYAAEVPDDRAKQAYNEFKPLDGSFRPNVVVQVKNGAIDFMPREPFHPLFGAMPRTALALELQITQEYLGGSTQLAYLAPLFEECLDSDTRAQGPGSTVARVIDGSLDGHELTVIAGVANTGTDRNWCGHPLAQANWYAFGRLAWDHALASEAIAREWTRMTFSPDPRVVQAIVGLLMPSREAVVNYSMPLGLHHIMAEGHHYGPGPWVSKGRPDWTSVYYHRADAKGIGFDRSPSGSDAVAQYAPPVARVFGDLRECPENLLLWFHHVPWDYELHSGRTLWDEICLHYQKGVDTVRQWQATWESLAGSIDAERHAHVRALLGIQESEARRWRDACLLYFQTFSQRPLPEGVEPADKTLEYHKNYHLYFVPGHPGDH